MTQPAETTHRRFDPATALVAVAVFGSFLAYSLVQAEIPGPNEPHYLCKAKHYWNPEFCPGDFFLDSANTHLVFYQTVGLLTLVFSFEQTALIGRIIAYALLAAGWTAFVSRLAGNRGAPLWAAWVFLAIATVGNLSGEWMVGGVEAKVFSYAFLLLGIAQVFDRRWWAAGALFGLAVSFHPIVGVWGVVAAGFAVAATMFRRTAFQGRPQEDNTRGTALEGRPTRRYVAAGVLLGIVCSLPGLIPALDFLAEQPHPRAADAKRLQVFERLAHHLDPASFRTVMYDGYEIHAAWLGYVLLAAVTILLNLRRNRSSNERWFGWFVIGTVLIALAGLAVGLVPRLENGLPDADSPLFDLRVSLMQFYPFRLVDAMLPVAAAVSLVIVVERLGENYPAQRKAMWGMAVASYTGLLAFSLLRPIPDRNPSHMAPDVQRDWLKACAWMQRELPPDAQVLTPQTSPQSWAFKWYAQRAEYVSYKDCPQDVAGILEWERRQRFLSAWGDRYYDEKHGYSKAALRKLAAEGITHIVYFREVQFAIPQIYPRIKQRNQTYRVYRLKDAIAN